MLYHLGMHRDVPHAIYLRIASAPPPDVMHRHVPMYMYRDTLAIKIGEGDTARCDA